MWFYSISSQPRQTTICHPFGMTRAGWPTMPSATMDSPHAGLLDPRHMGLPPNKQLKRMDCVGMVPALSTPRSFFCFLRQWQVVPPVAASDLGTAGGPFGSVPKVELLLLRTRTKRKLRISARFWGGRHSPGSFLIGPPPPQISFFHDPLAPPLAPWSRSPGESGGDLSQAVEESDFQCGRGLLASCGEHRNLMPPMCLGSVEGGWLSWRPPTFRDEKVVPTFYITTM